MGRYLEKLIKEKYMPEVMQFSLVVVYTDFEKGGC
jgi:hypothetical protein